MTEKNETEIDPEYIKRVRKEFERLKGLSDSEEFVNVVSTPLQVNDDISCLQSLEQALTTLEHQSNGVVDRKIVVEVKYGKQVYVATQDRQGKVSLTPRNKDGQITKASESIFAFYKRITQSLKQSYGIVSDESQLNELLASTAQLLVAYADSEAESFCKVRELESEVDKLSKESNRYESQCDSLRKELNDRANDIAWWQVFVGFALGALVTGVAAYLAGMLTNTLQ